MTTKVIKFRTAYSPKKVIEFNCVGKSRTQPQFAEDCDITTIVERYYQSGQWPTNARNIDHAQYGDFSNVSDFTDALELIQNAKENFQELPSSIRNKFHNNPAEFYEFVQDETNYDEMVDLGLAENRNNVGQSSGKPTEEGVKTPSPDSSGKSEESDTVTT